MRGRTRCAWPRALAGVAMLGLGVCWGPARSAQAAPWATVLGPSAGASPTAVAATPDGGLVAAAALGSGPWLVRLDAAGNVAWHEDIEEIAPSSPRRLQDIVSTPDGGATLLLWAATATDGVTTLLHVDPLGRPAWTTSWRVGHEDEPHELVQLSDGGYLVSMTDGDLRRPVIVRTDSVGRGIWAKALAGATSHLDFGLAAAADGGFLSIVHDGGPALLLRGAADGQVTWCRRLEGLASDDPLATGASFVEAPDRDWLIGANGNDPGIGAMAARVDANGALRWCRGYTPAGAGVPTARVTTDSGLLFLQSGLVTRIGPDGSWEWTQWIGGDRASFFFWWGDAAGDEVLLGGVSGDYPAFAKLDASGNPASCIRSRATWRDPVDLPAIMTPDSCTLEQVTITEEAPIQWSVVPMSSGAPCTNGCVADASEPDDAMGQAQSAGRASSARAGNFCDDAEDWLSLDACAGTLISIETDGLGPAADTVLDLFASDQLTLLASDDNGGVGLGSALTWVTSTAGPLYLRIRQADASVGVDRSYRILLTITHSASRTFMKAVGPVDGTRGSLTAALGSDATALLAGARSGDQAWLASIAQDGSVTWDATWPQVGPASGPTFVTVLASDGNTFVASAARASGADPFVFSRRAGDGSELWSRTYMGSIDDHEISAAAATTDGGLVVCGSRIPASGLPEAWVATIRDDATVAWDRSVSGAGFRLATCVATNSSGETLLAGLSSAGGFLTKLDANGSVIWDRLLSVSATAIASAADGGAYYLALREIIRFDAGGGPVWQRAVSDSSQIYPRVLSATGDMGLLLALDSRDRSFAVIARIISAGDVTWARRVDADTGTLQVAAVRELATGDVLVAAEAALAGQSPSARLIRLRSDGLLDAPCAAVSSHPVELIGGSAIVLTGDATARVVAGSLSDASLPMRDVISHSWEACNCACGNQAAPAEVSPASTRQPLRINRSGHAWWESRSIAGACWFNVYRGALSALPAGDHGECLASGIALNEVIDPTPPPAADAWFYLVTGESDAGEGPLGPTSLGDPRAITSACP